MPPWRSFSIEGRTKHAPSLFIKADFTDSTYAVFLTDLIFLWTEQLDRRAIMRRAMNEDTTIDPTNGPDQLKTLLEHLSGCLGGKTGTTTVLKSNSNHEQLNLTLSSELPSPLEPLRWPMTLKLDTQEQFSTELLQPALNALTQYQAGLSSLRSLIGEKDNVIQKLQGKIEVSGIELGAVFPGAGLRKGTNVKTTQRAVPGLAEFDYDSWITSTLNLKADLFATDSLPHVSQLDAHGAGPNSTPWWEDLPASDQEAVIRGQAAGSGRGLNAKSDVHMVEADAATEKRRRGDPGSAEPAGNNADRAIPERNKAFRKGSQSSTSSEEDASQFEQLRPQSAKSAVKNEVAESHLMVPESKHTEDAAAAAAIQVETSPAPPKRIGKLGGKKREIPPTTSSEKVLETQSKDQADELATSPNKTSKLGKIGGTAKAGTSESKGQTPATDDATKIKREASIEREGRKDAESAANNERETSQERADRRRAELKRQLEEKKKLPGAKKKQRKF